MDELAPAHEATFKPRADEARRLMTDARAAAEKPNAAQPGPVPRGRRRSARDGEADYKAGRFATAARKLLQARDRFDRAARTPR